MRQISCAPRAQYQCQCQRWQPSSRHVLLLTRFRLRPQVTDSRLAATRTDSRSDFAASQSSQMSAGPGDPPEICQSPSTASLHATCPDDILVIRIPRQLAGHGSRPRSPSRIWFGGGSWGGKSTNARAFPNARFLTWKNSANFGCEQACAEPGGKAVQRCSGARMPHCPRYFV